MKLVGGEKEQFELFALFEMPKTHKGFGTFLFIFPLEENSKVM